MTLTRDRVGIHVVLAALGDYGLKKSGSSWMARCPAHPDSTPSLSISEGDQQPVVFNCHAGCQPDDILAALNLTWSDVSAEREQPEEKAKISETYDYVDENGELLYQVVRMVPKSFRQRRPDGNGGWDWKLGDVRRPVYRLPEVLTAIANGDPVFVVEGEKDVEALRREGYVATCNSGGAGKWLHQHSRTLAGAEVVVVADRDIAGRKHARAVADDLCAVGCEVRCAEPVEGFKDTAAHLGAGFAVDQFVEVFDRWENADVDQQDDRDPGPMLSDATPRSAVDVLRSLILDGTTIKQIPSRRSLIKGWLDLNSLAVLYGRSGGGKSFIAIDLALHIAIGSWWHGHKTRKGNVLYVVAEGATGVADRQTAWEKHNRYQSGVDGIFWIPRPVNLLDPVDAQALVQVATELQPSLVVIDTLARSMPGGDENTGKDMGMVIAAADRVKVATGACVLVVHHSGKDETAGARGWSGLKGALDTELELKSTDNRLILSTTKQKDGAELPPMWLTLAPHRWSCPDCEGSRFGPDGDECDRCDGEGEIGSVAIAKFTGQSTGDGAVSTRAQGALDALVQIDTGDGVPSTQWQEVAAEQGISRTAFYLHVKTLVDAGLVRKLGTAARPRFTVA